MAIDFSLALTHEAALEGAERNETRDTAMADALERAKQDLAEKENSIKQMTAEADRIRAFIEMYGRYIEAKVPIPRGRPNGKGAARRGGRIAGEGKKYEIAGAAERLIRARAYPVPLGEIFDTLTTEGVEIGTKNPRQNLSAILYRDGRFQNILGKGWVMNAKKQEGPEAQTSEPSQ